MVLCRLCLAHKDECNDLMDIFDDLHRSTNISKIIDKFFCFEVHETDPISTMICLSCCKFISDFSAFYDRIKCAQESYFHCSTKSPNADNQPDNLKTSELLSLSPDNHFEGVAGGVQNVCKSNRFSASNNDESSAKLLNASDHAFEQQSHEQSIRKRSRTTNQSKRRSYECVRKQSVVSKQDQQIREFCDMNCTYCSTTFHTLAEAKKHYKTKHDAKGYVICCGRKMFKRFLILSHIVGHVDPAAHRCHICSKVCTNHISLRNHLVNMHQPGEALRFACSQCENRFAKEHRLSRHILERHCNEEEKKFKCDICDKNYISKPLLKAHIRYTHNAVLHICDFCAKDFRSKMALNLHRSQEHLGVALPKMQCNICGTWLKNKGSLSKHLKRHSARVETCHICSKVLQNQNSLGNHMRNVHGDRKHQCNVCEKGFTKAISLKEHMALHTGEDLYTCSYCPKTFKSAANMYAHRKRAHAEEYMSKNANK